MLDYAKANTDGDTWLFQSVVRLGQPKRSPTNYFSKANELSVLATAPVPFLPRSFIGGHAVINVARDPKMNQGFIDDIAIKFQILDLRAMLSDYIWRATSKLPHTVSGPHLSAHGRPLPFTHLAVWHMVHLQQTPFYSVSNLDPARTVSSFPPSTSWKYGRFDAVIFNVDSDKSWPHLGLSGESICCFESILPINYCVLTRPLHRRG